MLVLKSITKHYAGRTIFNNLNIPLSKKRTALVGKNGTGKSTLMKIMAKIESADSGEIITKKNCRVEYLPQQAVYEFTGTVFEEVQKWLFDDRIIELREMEADLIDKLQTSESHLLIEKLSEVQEELHQHEVKERKKNSIENILLNLGFSKETWGREAATLSGGWQMRIALARVLVREPDIILLDEPTNYLDISTIDFLAEWIMAFDGQILLVSHDRDFLNKLSEETWEVFQSTITIFRGNYDYYEKEKETRLETLEKQREKQLDEIKFLQEFVDKNKYNAATATLAQSKNKMLEKVKEELIVLPQKPGVMNFRLPSPKRGGEIVAEFSEVSHSFGDIDVIKDYKRIITRKERIALIGRNGFGKSTLMNILGGEFNPTSGTMKLGNDIEISYFRQHEITNLPGDMSVLSFVESVTPFNLMSRVKSILGAFLFFEDDWDKRVGVLSGGEKVRLAFIKMVMNPGNLLLLDEPTTHLDIDSKEILLKALKDIDATIVFVSHDTHFINSLATTVVYFRGKCDVVNFPGTYIEYQNMYGHDIIAMEKEIPKKIVEEAAPKGKNDYAQRKELRNKLNKLKKEISSLELLISKEEDEKSLLGEKINHGTGDVNAHRKAVARIDQTLATLLKDWETKTAEVEKLTAED